MTAGNHDITVECGATFLRQLTWKDADNNAIDLTGFSAKMQIRKKISDADAIVTLSSVDNTIELGGVAGTIVLKMSAVTTAAITAQSGVYDLELTSASGFVTRLLEGSVTFSKEVTK